MLLQAHLKMIDVEITATIEANSCTITEDSLEDIFKFEDADAACSKVQFSMGEGVNSLSESPSQPITTHHLTTTFSFNHSGYPHPPHIHSPRALLRVKKLEHKVKSRQPKRRARVVISDTKEDLEDPSKQGRRIDEIDQNPSILLVQDEGTSWIQEEAEIQGRTSADTEILLDQEEPTELVKDLGSGEKGEKEISTANISVSTASATPEVSTAAENLKKAMKQLEQERLGHKEAIRLQEQINEEERQRIARDAEIAKQLQEEFDRASQEQEVGGYKQSHFKGMSYEDIRLIFERVWDQNHDFVPKDSEIKKEVMKRPGFDFPQKSIKKNDKIKASSFVQKQPAKEEKEKKNDDSQQQAGSSKKRSREDSDEDNAKKQKLEDDAEKEELRDSMDVVPRDDIAIDVESLATKYPIVDWKTHVLTENMMYYQIIRADGSSKNYKIFSEMLDDFDRQDCEYGSKQTRTRKVYKVTASEVEECLEESS
ncbi:hypothetical protein Tco_1080301 [Tanacetum coccineum]|uniref:Uncharacterized protein n=1 Tax=Tanacetum coccineum TaxID=301880 RepID=A0ABQ5HUC7_9ASTR